MSSCETLAEQSFYYLDVLSSAKKQSDFALSDTYLDLIKSFLRIFLLKSDPMMNSLNINSTNYFNPHQNKKPEYTSRYRINSTITDISRLGGNLLRIPIVSVDIYYHSIF